MVFDKDLHDRLLEEVIGFDLERAPGNRLANQIAKRRARELLGWEPRVPLQEGLRKTIPWFRIRVEEDDARARTLD